MKGNLIVTGDQSSSSQRVDDHGYTWDFYFNEGGGLKSVTLNEVDRFLETNLPKDGVSRRLLATLRRCEPSFCMRRGAAGVDRAGAINRLTHTPVGVAGAQMNSYRLFVLTL